MIVLPLTEEAKSGRRVPWLTLLFAAACVLVFLHGREGDLRVNEEADYLAGEAWDYFTGHPYVRMDPDTEAMLGAEDVAKVREGFRESLERSGSPGIPSFVRQHDQVEFDAIVDELYATLEQDSFHRLGFRPGSLERPDPSWVTYVFAHEDWLHLAANLVLILVAGLFLEDVWGRVVYAIFLVTAAVAGALGYAILDPHATEPLGGASGVAVALGGAFFVRFAATRIRFQYILVPPIMGKFTARGWVTLPLYGGLYLLVDYLLTHGVPGVEPPDAELATWAHVGGLAWGVVFAALMRLLRIEQRFVRPTLERKATSRSNPALERALEAREAGRVEEAVELLAAEVARHPTNVDASLAFWDAATAAGDPRRAADALLHVLRDEVARGQGDLAITHWKELTQRVPDAVVEAPLEVRIAALLLESGDFELAGFSMRRVVEGRCGRVGAAVAHRLARAARDVDVEVALAAARMALSAPDLDAGDRGALERLVRELEGASDRETARSETAAASGTDARGFFEDAAGADDLDPHARELPAEDDEFADDDDAPDPDGDTLGAAPFELPDLEVTQPPGAFPIDPDRPDAGSPAAPEGTSVPSHATASPDAAAPPEGGAREVSLEAEADAPDDVELDPTPGVHGRDAMESDGALDPEDFGDAPGDTLGDRLGDPLGDQLGGWDTEPGSLLDHAGGLDPADLGDTAPPDDTDGPHDPDPHALDPERLGQSLGESAPPDDTDGLGVPDPHAFDAEGLADSLPPDLTVPPRPADVSTAPEPHPYDDTLAAAELEPLPEATAGDELDDDPDLEPPLADIARTLKRMDAIPLALGDEAITVDVGERGKAQLRLDRIEAVAVAGVRGLRPRPVIVIDLVTNWLAGADEPLKVVRLRSDRFDPRRLVPEEEEGFAALKAWIARLVERSQALPLPDAGAVAGRPFRMFDDLADYEREVLHALPS